MNKEPNFQDAIYQILGSSNDFVPLAQIYTEVKKILPDLCDDRVLCPWCKIGKHPKWQHQCRWAVLNLKQRKLVKRGKRGFWKSVAKV